MLLAAADDYNPGVTAEDILRGDENGNLNLDGPLTRAQAMVMLSRAFGDLPEPVGDNARRAYDATDFTDIPVWAQTELADVLEAGIVAGTSATTFSPNEPVTEAQLALLIQRVYTLEGSNLRDDFYATVNKEWLDSSVIPAGYTSAGTIYEMTVRANEQVAEIIAEIVASDPAPGSREEKIKNLYENVINWEARDAAGIEPIRPWLEAIDQACRTLGGWRLWQCTLYVTLEPCPMCAGAILNARIPRVVFGARDPKAGACGSVCDLFSEPFNHHPACTAGVLEEPCAQILRDFFRNLRVELPNRTKWKRPE